MACKAVIYARYSSDRQRDASIDDQLRICREWCSREGYEVTGEYCDRALSGKTDRRPEFRRMIANAPESDVVLVYAFDRFSRDRYDAAMYKRELRLCGVRVVSATERVDETPEGALQEGLFEVLSEYYVRDLARKVRRGMEGNALKAQYNGYPIYGYNVDPVTRRYTVNESEAQIVREAFERHAGGETVNSIARDLASRGITTSAGNPVGYNWAHKLLNRTAYVGVYSWGGIEIEGGMPAIIDEETFQRSRRVKGARRAARGDWTDYRLTGKLFCGLCGQPMHGYSATGKQGRKYFYYGCKKGCGCGRPGVRRELVEDALAEAVLDVTADEGRMRTVARHILAEYSGENDPARVELESVEARIADLERERANLAHAASMGLVNDEMVRRNNEISELLRPLHERRGVLMSQDEGLTEDDIVAFLAHGFNRDDEDFIFGTAISQVYLYDDCMLAVFGFRDEVGGDTEEMVALETKKGSIGGKGFDQNPHGGPMGFLYKPVAVPGGFGLLVRLAA